jgi:hypothetical protein
MNANENSQSPPASDPLYCSALRGDWNTHMPCGHLRQFGTLGDVFPVHCLACENEQLRQKLKVTKRYLRAANKGAERNSIVAQLLAIRNVKLAAEIDALRKSNAGTQRGRDAEHTTTTDPATRPSLE